MKDVAFFDIEADHLLHDASKIWCIVTKQNKNYFIYTTPDFKEELTFPEGILWHTTDIQDYLKFLRDRTMMVGHNIISYDLPLLKKLHNFEYTLDQNKIADTHILSRLFNPDRLGHSLEWYGEKFMFPKGDHQDFTQLSQEMLDYCIRDVDLTERIYHYLSQEQEDWDWSEAIKLEYNIWHVQMKQEEHGVLFDKDKAEHLHTKIVQEIKELEEDIQSKLPLFPKNAGELKKIFLKSGDYTTPVKEWLNGV